MQYNFEVRMETGLYAELAELLARWHELAQHARVRAQHNPNGTYDGYMLGLELAADDLTRVLGQTLKQQQAHKADN
jgi:hypothetical protein